MFSIVLLAVMVFFSGCLGGSGGGTPSSKSYKLVVTVRDAVSEKALAGALVSVVGKALSVQETDKDGKTTFSNLSGTVEIEVDLPGFDSKTTKITINKDEDKTIALNRKAGTVLISETDDLQDVFDDPNVKSVILGEDVVLEGSLKIERAVDLNLNGKTLTGDLEYAFNEEEELQLGGAGELDGNLAINAPNASVVNALKVSGEINIEAVAEGTWHEHGKDNSLILSGSYLRVNLYGNTKKVDTIEDSWDNKLNILDGKLEHLIANSSIRVTGGDRVKLATINSYGVVFDLSPEKIEGDYTPRIIQSFVPGSGGTISSFTPTTPEPNKFSGFYVEKNHRWPNFSGGHSSEVDFRFRTPESLGGTSYKLQYFDSADSSWKHYQDVETSSPSGDNFSFAYYTTTKFRLLMVGGELDGYTSNEVEVVPSSIGTYFSGWSMTSPSPYVGESFTAGVTAKNIKSGETISTEYLSYQWYRVDPVTFEQEKIANATGLTYTVQTADMGHGLLFKATGDNKNVGGYVQVFAPASFGYEIRSMLVPNKAYITEMSASGFVLNLHKKVSDLTKEQIEIELYYSNGDYEILEAKSVEFLPGSQAKLKISVDIPQGLDMLSLRGRTDYWGITSNYHDEDEPYIREQIDYHF